MNSRSPYLANMNDYTPEASSLKVHKSTHKVFVAHARGNSRILSALLEADADPALVNKKGESALLRAVKANKPDIVIELLKYPQSN